mgnify:CR=1 FL=1
MTDRNAISDQKHRDDDPSIRALATNRQMFLGFLVNRLGNLSEAEDVLQEFCLRVIKRKDQLRDAEKLNGWLYSVLRSALNRICACVNGLVPELRAADADLIRRIDIDEDDRATVAADLGLKPGTLAVRLHRARAALADTLLGHCGFCCKHGFEDCSCPPAGCEHPVAQTDCTDGSSTV